MGRVSIRPAEPDDLDALLEMYRELAEDPLEGPAEGDRAAELLAKSIADPDRHLAVALLDGVPAGTADLLLVANLTHQGRPWAIVENVVVSSSARRTGVGRELMSHLIGLARAAGCYKVQLISGKQRPEAHAFYRSLGFDARGEGFKLYLDET
jgi:GNAT superfamily N-acetyltransferase